VSLPIEQMNSRDQIRYLQMARITIWTRINANGRESENK